MSFSLGFCCGSRAIAEKLPREKDTLFFKVFIMTDFCCLFCQYQCKRLLYSAHIEFQFENSWCSNWWSVTIISILEYHSMYMPCITSTIIRFNSWIDSAIINGLSEGSYTVSVYIVCTVSVLFGEPEWLTISLLIWIVLHRHTSLSQASCDVNSFPFWFLLDRYRALLSSMLGIISKAFLSSQV